MNLDDLMEVWRSQDAAPLHGVNETLLRLALRQEEANLQKQRRREEWITYLASAGLVAVMACFCVMMFYNDDDVIIGWDYGIPIIGAAAALLWGVALYVSRRAQTSEQRFGESLRDQLARRMAQLDYQATRGVRLASVLVTALPPFVCATRSSSPACESIANPTSPSMTGSQSPAGSSCASTRRCTASGSSAARCNGTSCRASGGWSRC